MKVVTTIPSLVEALGGFANLARWAGYEDSRGIHNWVARGIPPAYHLRLTLEARRRGIEIDPSIFELDDQDAEVLRAVLSGSGKQERLQFYSA